MILLTDEQYDELVKLTNALLVYKMPIWASADKIREILKDTKQIEVSELPAWFVQKHDITEDKT